MSRNERKMLFKEERLNEILNILHQYGYATVEYLANTIHTSPSSIRRDLTVLENSGIVKRSYGGATLILENNASPPFLLREQEKKKEKHLVVKIASELLKEGDTIFMDASSTTMYLTDYLHHFENLTVITNNLKVASQLGETNVKVYCTGGYMSEKPSVLTGPFAEEMIKSMHTDWAFFSTQRFSEDGIITDCYEAQTKIRSLMIKNAENKVYLCTANKMGTHSLFRQCDMNEIDYVISDKKLPETLMENFSNVKFLY